MLLPPNDKRWLPGTIYWEYVIVVQGIAYPTKGIHNVAYKVVHSGAPSVDTERALLLHYAQQG